MTLAGALGALIFACSPGRKGDLEPGVPVEREIGGGEVHSYRLPLEADSYLSLRIEQPGMDVAARLDGPDGESVPIPDDRGGGGDDGPDRLAWISKHAGEYRLVVRARDAKAPRGRYRIEIWELRRARSGDADRVAAEKEYFAGLRLGWRGEGQRLASLAHFNKALQLWEKTGDQAGQVDALVMIAENYNGQSRPREAVAPGRRALEIARSIQYRSGEARAFQALGNAHNRLSDWLQALDSYEQSLRLWQHLQNRSRQGANLYLLAQLYYGQSQFDRTLDTLQRARSLLVDSDDAALSSKALVLTAYTRMDLGETAKALEACKEALKLARSSREVSAEASALFCLGAAYKQRGELEAARELFEQSLALNLEIGDLDNQADIHHALGSVYFNLGDTENALLKYAQALATYRRIGSKAWQARVLTNTGWILQAGGDTDHALAHYREALPLHKEVDSKSGIALTLNNTGVAYVSLGRPREGLSYLQNALELRSQSNQHAAQANTLLKIGTAYRALKDFPEAADYFRRALELAGEVENTNLQAECLFRWASLDAAEGRLLEARDKIKRSLGIIEAVRSDVTIDKLRTAFFASKREYYELYLDLLMRLEALHPGQYRAAALEASERARARGLLDLLAEGHINLQKGIAPELRQREIELGARLSFLQDQLGRAERAQVAALERQLADVQADMERLESQIRRQHQQYAEVRYPTPLKAREIQDLLDERTALIQYFTGKQGSFAFVVTSAGIESYRLPSHERLAYGVKALRELLQNRVGRRQLLRYQDLAGRLYTQLLGPAAGALRGKSHLLIAPDGPLYLLPFEALLTDRNKGGSRAFEELPYALRRFAFSYIPSASVLKGIRAPRSSQRTVQASKRFVGFADPPYEGGDSASGVTRGAGPGLARLLESRKEVQRIASLYPRDAVALYLGTLASEDNVKRNEWLAQAQQIHFATHGNLNEARPQFSGLELARTGKSREDGTLRVYEIFNLRLNADLLTLSACDTGLGKEVGGEGIVGMMRAFFYAGAKSLVVSLWPVSDRSTPDLMFDFYSSLGKSQKKAEALRRAKLAMIESKSYAEPYFWAPFILSGDPE